MPDARRAPSDAHPDAALIARLKTGDDAAFEELVRDYGPRMLAVARRFLPRDADAEDALQDAFVSVVRGIRSFAGESRLSTWLHRITVNAALMRIRTRSRRPETPLEDANGRLVEDGVQTEAWGFTATEALIKVEVRLAVQGALARLPDEVRAIVRLRDIEGLDLREIAGLLGLGLTTVKTRLHRGRLALRGLLDAELGARSR
jgi:RNA polymerase sigma-70 factor (ECF subfamily)